MVLALYCISLFAEGLVYALDFSAFQKGTKELSI